MASSSGSSLNKDTTKRLLKCFCGCTDLTVEEVQRIYRASAQATLIDRQASQMLRAFLEQLRCGDKSETAQYLDVYQQCDKYMQQSGSILTLDELDELCDMGLPYHLERELKLQLQTGDDSNIKHALMRIQGECRNEIESSEEYRQFKEAILDKLHHRRN